MDLIVTLKGTVAEAVKLARTAGQQAQRTAVPSVRQTARVVRSRLEQRLVRPPAPRPTGSGPQPAPAIADEPAASAEKSDMSAVPTPARVAKNIAPKPGRATSAARRKQATKAAPGAKLPVKRTPTKPDPA